MFRLRISNTSIHSVVKLQSDNINEHVDFAPFHIKQYSGAKERTSALNYASYKAKRKASLCLKIMMA